MAGENTDPARAFDDLRAEVSVLRRAVEGLPDAWRENRPPDYSPDLGRMVNALDAVGWHLEAIEKNPMLKIEPSSYRHAVEQAGMAASREMRGVFDSAIREVQGERRQLAGIIGQARNRHMQRKWLGVVGIVMMLVGTVMGPVIARELPAALSSRISAFVAGDMERWKAGQILMEDGDADQFASLARGSRLWTKNDDRLQACAREAEAVKRDIECSIIVPANGG